MLKRIIRKLQLKKQGLDEIDIMTILVFEGLITFEQYEKYYDKKVKKEERR